MITVATMMRTDVLRKVGRFDATIVEGMEDWDLWIRSLDHGHWGYTIPEFLYWYRVSPPGKWRSINDPVVLQEFKDQMKIRYPNAYTNKTPKLSIDSPPLAKVVSEFPFTNTLTKANPRLLLISTNADIGGADQFNYNLVKGLAKDGWEITVVVINAGENPMLKYYQMITPDIFVLHNFLPFNEHPRFLAYLIGSRRPDITLITNCEAGYVWLSYLKVFAPDTKYVDYLHSEEPTWKLGGYPRYSTENNHLLDRTLVASKHLQQWVVDRGHNSSKISIVRNGIDVALFTRSESMRQQVRAQYNISSSTKVILYIARLVDAKLPFVFVKVMQELASRNYNFAAFVIGSGYLEHQIRDLLSNAGLSQVHMLGPLGNEKVRNVMSAGDIIFLPTEIEGISLALMEGMAMGLVPISVNVGGQAELIDKDTGFLINLEPNRDDMVSNFVTCFDQLFENNGEALIQSMASNSKKLVASQFSTTRMVDDMKKQFCNAASSSKQAVDVRKVLVESTRLGAEFIRMQNQVAGSKPNDFKPNEVADHSSSAPLYPVAAEWNEGITLLGVGLPNSISAGDTFPLTFIWGSRGATTVPYRNFVHFRDKDGNRALNADRYPTSHGKESMTDLWKYGDVIIDSQNVLVPPSAKSGKWSLVVGWFDLKSGHRLALKKGGNEVVTGLEIEVYVLS